MRAAVLHQPGKPLEVREVTPRKPGPHEPVVVGHEAAGTVAEVGSEVTHLRSGDRVIVTPITSCGRCASCVRGEPYLRATYNATDTWPVARELGDGLVARGWRGLGTFADRALLREQSVVRVTTDLPSEQLAVIGCAVMTGLGPAVNTAGVRPGDTVVVVGAGGIGLSAIQGARMTRSLPCRTSPAVGQTT